MLLTMDCPTPIADGPVEFARRDLASTGRALITGVDRDIAERILLQLGELMPQDDGLLRYDVKSTAAARSLSSSKSANPLNPHTEASYHPVPPRLIALFCVRAARCGGGQTLTADGYRIVEHLNDRERRVATVREVRFADHTRPLSFCAPVLEPDRPPVLRFSYNLLRHRRYDPEAALIAGAPPARTSLEKLADRFLELFQRLQEPVRLPENALLVIDNRRMIHGRTGYTDSARHLVRYWLT